LPRRRRIIRHTFLCLIMQIIFPLQFKIAAKIEPANLFIIGQFFCSTMLKYFTIYQ
jgi:hypothetical protein